MENQHRQIAGYRDLTPYEVRLMNDVKAEAEVVALLVEKLSGLKSAECVPDQRWVAIARTHLQQGFMALTRAVAKPTTF
jgi:hypothetical protein